MCMYMYSLINFVSNYINIHHLFQSSNRTRLHVHLYPPLYFCIQLQPVFMLIPNIHLSSTTFIPLGAIQSLSPNIKW